MTQQEQAQGGVFLRYLNEDGTFNLSEALYERCADHIGSAGFRKALDFIDEVEDLTRITNVEAAVITYSYAASLARTR